MDVLGLRDHITRLLLDADGAVFLSVKVAAMPPDLKFRYYIAKNIANVVCHFKEVWTITNNILESLDQYVCPLWEMGVLVLRLNALHNAMCCVSFD
jgi:hypothetical protein